MKKIILIRHAESEANAGTGLFPSSHIIKITEKGKQQAQDLVELIDKPDRIIVSKFIRTQETAEPLIKKLLKDSHDHEVHLWFDTHEFDSVSMQQIAQLKSHEDFLLANESFWLKADPFYKDDEGHESFAEFTDRVNNVILKLKKIPDGVNYIFTHGWFIKMLHLMCTEFPDFNNRINEKDIYLTIMQRFSVFDKEFRTLNTGVRDVTELVENYA